MVGVIDCDFSGTLLMGSMSFSRWEAASGSLLLLEIRELGKRCVSICVSNACEYGSFCVGSCRPESPATHCESMYFLENKGLVLAPVTAEVAGSNQFFPAIIFNRLPKRGFRPSRFRQGQCERRDHNQHTEG